jgi:hypothetical protein
MSGLYNRLVKSSKVNERLTSRIGSRDKWIAESKNQENAECIRDVCGIRALIECENIRMCGVENLIYKAISSTTRELLPKYKEKYMSSVRQALEYWEMLTEVGAEDEGKYLKQANILKEDYDCIEWLISTV